MKQSLLLFVVCHCYCLLLVVAMATDETIVGTDETIVGTDEKSNNRWCFISRHCS